MKVILSKKNLPKCIYNERILDYIVFNWNRKTDYSNDTNNVIHRKFISSYILFYRSDYSRSVRIAPWYRDITHTRRIISRKYNVIKRLLLPFTNCYENCMSYRRLSLRFTKTDYHIRISVRIGLCTILWPFVLPCFNYKNNRIEASIHFSVLNSIFQYASLLSLMHHTCNRIKEFNFTYVNFKWNPWILSIHFHFNNVTY